MNLPGHRAQEFPLAMAAATAMVSLKLKASWDTQQRLPYNPHRSPKPKKNPNILTPAKPTQTPPTVTLTTSATHTNLPASLLLNHKTPNPGRVKLEESYLGSERWLPTPPKVKKPRSVYNSASLAYIGDCIYELYAHRHFLFPPLNIEEYNDRVMAVVHCEAQVAFCVAFGKLQMDFLAFKDILDNIAAKLNDALSGPVEALLDGASNNAWPAIRKLLRRETESAVSCLSGALSGFEMDEQTRDKMLADLEDYARGVVEAKARKEAGRVLKRMKDRFASLFSRDSDSIPRVWTWKEDIRAITKTARSSSLKLLSVLAAIRLDDDAENIEKTLSAALVESGSNTVTSKSITSVDPLASSTWEEVPSSKTLITPVQCKSLWRQFKTETEYTVTLAIAAQEADKRNNNLLPPPWAIVALVILGFNALITLLRNPLVLVVILAVFLLMKALWAQLDILGEFRNGALPGLLSISTKFLPTVMNLLRKLAKEGQKPATTDSQRNSWQQSKNFRNGVNTSDMSLSASSEITSSENVTEYSSPSKQD